MHESEGRWCKVSEAAHHGGRVRRPFAGRGGLSPLGIGLGALRVGVTGPIANAALTRPLRHLSHVL